jgi:hypothetical protein
MREAPLVEETSPPISLVPSRSVHPSWPGIARPKGVHLLECILNNRIQNWLVLLLPLEKQIMDTRFLHWCEVNARRHFLTSKAQHGSAGTLHTLHKASMLIDISLGDLAVAWGSASHGMSILVRGKRSYQSLIGCRCSWGYQSLQCFLPSQTLQGWFISWKMSTTKCFSGSQKF